MKCPK